MSNPAISVVIPVYNGRATLGACLESIFSSPFGDLEVIVVDDHSTDGSGEIAARYPCSLVSLREGPNAGAGAARNAGARRARGELLLFVDADVVHRRDTIPAIAAAFRDDPSLEVLSGMYAKEPLNSGFGARFLALKTFYFATRGPERRPITFVQSACLAIRRELFVRSGGFTEDGSAEEYEYGHRLSRGHRIVLDRRIVVEHHFPQVLERLAEVTRRTYHWFFHFLRRLRFESDGGTASPQEGLTAILVCTAAAALLAGAVLLAWQRAPAVAALATGASLLAVALAVNAGLYRFLRRERSVAFAARAVLADFLLYLGIGCGAAAAAAVASWRRLAGSRPRRTARL